MVIINQLILSKVRFKLRWISVYVYRNEFRKKIFVKNLINLNIRLTQTPVLESFTNLIYFKMYFNYSPKTKKLDIFTAYKDYKLYTRYT